MRSWLRLVALLVSTSSGCGAAVAPPIDGGPSLRPEEGAVSSSCSPDGWCWENPLPTGNGMRAVSAVAANDVFVVGDHGTVLHWDGRTWTTSQAPTGDLTWVWASGSNDAWAVAATYGFSSPSTGLFHWDGATWSRVMDAALVGFSPDTVWGSSSTDVWVTGASDGSGAGTGVRHFDGHAWSVRRDVAPSGYQSIVSGSGPTDVWFSGDVSSMSLTYWDGAHARAIPWVTSDADSHVVALHAVARDDAWLLTPSTLQHWDGTAWSVVSFPMGNGGRAVPSQMIGASAPDDVWILAGTDLAHWDGRTWSLAPVVGATPASITMSTARDAWLVGALGSVVHFDGDVWTPALPRSIVPSAPDAFTDAWTDGTSIWAVGRSTAGEASGGLWHFDGATWHVEDVGSTSVLSVSGTAADDVWVGAAGTVLHFDGTGWSAARVDVETTSVGALWARARDDAWAATGAQVLRWNGTRWATWPVYTSSTAFAHVTRFGGSAADDVWIAEDVPYPTATARVLHWDGAALTSGTAQFGGWRHTDPRIGILSNASGDAWLAACDRIVRVGPVSDATAFAVDGERGCDDDPEIAIVRAPSGRIWATRGPGAMITTDGTTWTTSETGTSLSLHALVSSATGTVRALGEGGAILRHDP